VAPADDDADAAFREAHGRGAVLNRRAARWIAIAAAAVVVAGGPPPRVAAQGSEPRQKKILVLYATRRDAQIAVVGERELPQYLEAGLPEGLDYYSEFIDQSRFSRPEYQQAFGEFLQLKYQAQGLDLVVAMGDVPLDFLSHNRTRLFAGTPIVYFASMASPRQLQNATGIVAPLNLGATLDLLMSLQPDVTRVFVVAGAESPGVAAAARSSFRPYEKRLTFVYLEGLPTKTLEERLASLPDHSAVFFLVVERGGAGETVHPIDYLERITTIARVPVYCWVDSAIGRGIVGGSLKSQEMQAKAIADVSLRVLRGERADSIPVSRPDLNVMQVDWRQLRRWDIPESRVPAGAVVKFREPTAWERYRGYITAATVLLIGQTALIAALLVQRTRRRKAEARERESQAELQRSYDRIRDLGARLLHAQDAERARVARELHDDISQQMALLESDLDVLRRNVPNANRQLAEDTLERAHSVGRSVHDLSHRLHPERLRFLGLVRSLDSLVRELSADALFISFTHENVPAGLSPELTACVFRVTQEALQNAVKYSRGRQAEVRLTREGGWLVLTIVDDGTGFDVDAVSRKGLGLISMRERVLALGGTIDIRSTLGAGTSLELRVPIEPAAAAAG
jgi:signal transduction histidine kinase